MTTSAKARAFAAGLLLAAQSLFCAAAVGQPVTAAPVLADDFPFCAWWAETTATSLNVAFPDTSAAYWTTPLSVSPDLVSVTVAGQYTDARYFSLNAYNNGGASYTCGTASSALADYLIAPDSGSQNPFQTSATPGGRYTVTLAHPGAGAPVQNTIPLYDSSGCQPAPAQGALPNTLSFLILRVYLPHDGFSNVVLPDLTLHLTGGRSVTLPRCRARQSSPARVDATAGVRWSQALSQFFAFQNQMGEQAFSRAQSCGSPGGPACVPELMFFRPPDSATGGLFPNVDNKYVAAMVQPKPATVVVIRAKGASFPPGNQALPWNPQLTDVRYWSMCSNIYHPPYPVVEDNVAGQAIPGCAPDVGTVQDAGGFYTYVVSHVQDKPSDAALAASAATWLPFSNTQPYASHLMIFRNMLGADFPQSVQNCAAGSDRASIDACAASMGAYYPEVAECQAQTFEAAGVVGCFGEDRLAQPSRRRHGGSR